MIVERCKSQHPLFWVGCAALVVAVLMTVEFGRSMSALHAGAMGLLTVLAALMWPEIDRLWRTKRYGVAGFLGALGVVFVAVELFSHIGYTVGHRVRDTEETGVQNARFQMAGDEVADGQRNLAMWRTHLEKLQAEQPWVATVSADGLRAELANLEGDFIFKRSKQCTDVTLPDSRKHCDRVAEVRTRIGLAEAKDDLTKKIEATQRLVSSGREKARSTEFRSSKIVSQTKFVSQLVTQEIEPGQEAMTWVQIAIAFAVALVTTFTAPVAFFLARNGRTTATDRAPHASLELDSVPRHTIGESDAIPSIGQPGPHLSITRVLTDARMASATAAALAPFRPKAAQIAA